MKSIQSKLYRMMTGAVMAVLMVCAAFMISTPLVAGATTIPPTPTISSNVSGWETRDPDAQINDSDRSIAYILIIDYINSMKARYDLTDESLRKIDEIFYQANVYIANTTMTVRQLQAYVVTVETNLDSVPGQTIPSSTSGFLFLCNEVPVTNARYGQPTTLTLALINLGKEGVTDVVITPTVSTKVSEWPFVIQTATDARMIAALPAADSVEQSYALRQEVSWDFAVAADAMTGTYPLTFHVKYYRNGGIEETDLTTYINITGAPESGTLESLTPITGNTSTPRIIVTGFSTDPAEVYAGDTFNLTIDVQNTSSQTAVSNIQFDLAAAQAGDDKDTTYEAFLPTSGSATIYVDRIAPGATTQISIEMTARSDLTQKPYVIEVKANYEDELFNKYQAESNLSIPVKQNARVDTGEADVLPGSIAVGGSTNIMFSVYNMGKTTLYNVQVAFEGDTISGGNTFIGKIEPGATGNVDAMVDGIAPTMDEGYITAVVSYEDEAGNVSTLEKEIMLYVYEESYDAFDDFYYDPMMEEGGDMDGGGLAIGWIIAIIAAVVIVIVVIIVIIVRKKKKKKADLLKDLEDIESLDD
ncbi:MAG: hypothetical protein K2J95_06565 [Lachnospiraceae bacterium]|nr:hypothetical protein [Lachnospiraceae bacterium]